MKHDGPLAAVDLRKKRNNLKRKRHHETLTVQNHWGQTEDCRPVRKINLSPGACMINLATYMEGSKGRESSEDVERWQEDLESETGKQNCRVLVLV